MNIRERASEIRGIFYTNCKDIIFEPFHLTKTESQKFLGDGTIFSEIKFIGNYLLNFNEEIINGNISRYSYEFICLGTGFFFVYENEGRENGIMKPLHHLHVGIKRDLFNADLLDFLPEKLIEHDGPHYKAPEMKFNEFMGMIIVNFFSDHRNSGRMLRSLGLRG